MAVNTESPEFLRKPGSLGGSFTDTSSQKSANVKLTAKIKELLVVGSTSNIPRPRWHCTRSMAYSYPRLHVGNARGRGVSGPSPYHKVPSSKQ